jgi:hypothetical protein
MAYCAGISNKNMSSGSSIPPAPTPPPEATRMPKVATNKPVAGGCRMCRVMRKCVNELIRAPSNKRTCNFLWREGEEGLEGGKGSVLLSLLMMWRDHRALLEGCEC